MTHRMVQGVFNAYNEAEIMGAISVFAQAADKPLGFKSTSTVEFKLTRHPKNLGFGVGMNRALGVGARQADPDAVLCINNDIEFPHSDWLTHLLAAAKDRVAVPTNTYSACELQQRPAREDRDPFDVGDTPAVCWLLPWKACQVIFRQIGNLKLFREDLGLAWGEDVYSSAVLRHKWHPEPFRIVPRGFVRHLGAKTSSKIPMGHRMTSTGRARKLIRQDFGGW
jgi:hypothetical protein